MTPTTTEDVQAERTLERVRDEIRRALRIHRDWLVRAVTRDARHRRTNSSLYGTAPVIEELWAFKTVIQIARAAGIDVKAAMGGKS